MNLAHAANGFIACHHSCTASRMIHWIRRYRGKADILNAEYLKQFFEVTLQFKEICFPVQADTQLLFFFRKSKKLKAISTPLWKRSKDTFLLPIPKTRLFFSVSTRER
jgi:hypothetical protein